LWTLLRKAIDRLQPANSEPEPTPGWRLFTIAEGVYVQGKSGKEMAAELGISPRTFHRERRAAVEALATVVWQIECGLRGGRDETRLKPNRQTSLKLAG
jgi:AraC-like DNA-binding protein